MKENFKLIPNLDYFKIDPLKFRGRGFFKKVEEDKNKYLKKFSYLIQNKKMVCPLCKNKKIKIFLRVTKKYLILACEGCELKFPNVDFVNNKKYADIIYEKYSQLNIRKNMEKTSKYRLRMMEERFNYCVKSNFKKIKSIKLLDYGCGNGLFLDYLKKKGISGTGIEIDEANSQKLVNKKIKFFRNINEVESNKFDICVMFDVLEHLTNPIRDLLKIRNKLKKKGIIVIYTPNINSLAFELMGPKQNQVYPFTHTLFFNDKSFNYLAKKTKMKIKKSGTFGLDLMDYFFMREYLDKKKYFEKLTNFINITQSLVDKTGLGNHFRVIFQK
tara:strand:- start:4623 stop:5609 length:987 start_codon:yes stop_codon:yes gene_type:complete